METKNIKFLTLLVAFFVGLVILLLSFFEKGVTSLIYQLVSIVLLSVSVILFYLCFIMDTKGKVKIVSVSKPKPKTSSEEKPKIEIVKEEPKPKVVIQTDKDEDFFKKNIVSIDLDEDDELNSDEKKIIKALKKQNGSMQQKDITDEVFKKNKVKSHRVLSSLIEKDQVIKRKEGKTNKIFLK